MVWQAPVEEVMGDLLLDVVDVMLSTDTGIRYTLLFFVVISMQQLWRQGWFSTDVYLKSNLESKKSASKFMVGVRMTIMTITTTI